MGVAEEVCSVPLPSPPSLPSLLVWRPSPWQPSPAPSSIFRTDHAFSLRNDSYLISRPTLFLITFQIVSPQFPTIFHQAPFNCLLHRLRPQKLTKADDRVTKTRFLSSKDKGLHLFETRGWRSILVSFWGWLQPPMESSLWLVCCTNTVKTKHPF